MPSNLERLSAVARSALPRFNRKLRANPSLTRTTSPIWPSLATRSSRITSIVVSPFVGLDHSSGWQGRRSALARHAAAKVEDGVRQAEDGHGEDRPAEHDGGRVGAREQNGAAG